MFKYIFLLTVGGTELSATHSSSFGELLSMNKSMVLCPR